MRRGLMAWDPAEIPEEALRARIACLKAAMAAASLDAVLVYTNFVRSSAVAYLTAFSPYWADGVLLVPADGDIVFATTLSRRVGSWIQSVKPIGDILHSPTPGKVLADHLSARSARRIGVLELDAFPSGLYDDLAGALPHADIVDASDVFASARRVDAVERRLLAQADGIAREAFSKLKAGRIATAGEAVGTVERFARLQGAEEAYVAIAPDLDKDHRFLRLSGEAPLARRFAIRATLAYKGAWIRRAKTYSSDAQDAAILARLDAWHETVLRRIDPRLALDTQMRVLVHDLPHLRLRQWTAEAAVGTHPLAVVASSRDGLSSPTPKPDPCVLTVAVAADGVGFCGAGLLAHAAA